MSCSDPTPPSTSEEPSTSAKDQCPMVQWVKPLLYRGALLSYKSVVSSLFCHVIYSLRPIKLVTVVILQKPPQRTPDKRRTPPAHLSRSSSRPGATCSSPPPEPPARLPAQLPRASPEIPRASPELSLVVPLLHRVASLGEEKTRIFRSALHRRRPSLMVASWSWPYPSSSSPPRRQPRPGSRSPRDLPPRRPAATTAASREDRAKVVVPALLRRCLPFGLKFGRSSGGGYVYKMSILNAELSKVLPMNKIFFRGCSPELERGSTAIVEKCDGLPLALVLKMHELQ